MKEAPDGEGADGEGIGDAELTALLAAAGEIVDAAPPAHKRPRRRVGAYAPQHAAANLEEVAYPYLNTTARAFYERFKDADRAQPLVRQRKRARPGRFDSDRLRALEDSVLSLNMGYDGQNKVYKLVCLWDRTFPGTSGDDGRSLLLAESFKSAHAFRQAISDDIDEAEIDDGWLSCTFFRKWCGG